MSSCERKFKRFFFNDMESHDSQSFFKVEKLNYDNYSSWSFRMKMILEKEDVLEAIEENPPNPITDAWTKKSKRAKQLIVLGCDNNQLVHLKQCTTGREAWDTLKGHHQQKSVADLLRVTRRLFSTRLPSNGSMRQHMDMLFTLMDELREMDEPLKETVAVSLMLNSLNSEYDNMVVAIEAWDDTKLTIKSVKSKLIQEWEKRRGAEKYEDEVEVKFVRSEIHGKPFNMPRNDRGENSSQSTSYAAPKRSDDFLCHFCRLPGHFRRDCPDLRIKLKRLSKGNELNKNRDESAKLTRASKWYKALCVGTNKRNTISWCVDSGATAHMCGNKHLFNSLDESHKSHVVVASGERIKAEGIGTIKLLIGTDKGKLEVIISEALWVPELNDNLVSVLKLVQKGHTVEFNNTGCYIKNGDETFLIAQHHDNLYKLRCEENCFAITCEREPLNGRCIHEWHKRLAHRNLEDIRRMERDGLKITSCSHADLCESCIIGKISRLPFPKIATPTKANFDCIVSDICGPIQVESFGRKSYFITFTDLHSRYTDVMFLREKSEAADVTINYIERIKTQFGVKPKVFRTDRGKEFLNKKLQNYLLREGIHPQCTVGYAAEQNGVAERKNRTLVEAARTMMAESNLSIRFWAEAVSTANYVFNRISRKKAEKSPYEMLLEKKPKLNDFYEFGSDVFVMIPDEKRRKLDDKAVKMKFVGYDDNAKGYRLVDKNQKIHVSREVRFLDRSCVKKDENQTSQENEIEEFLVSFNDQPSCDEDESFHDAESGNEGEAENQGEAEIQGEAPLNPPDAPAIAQAEPQRSARSNIGKPPRRYDTYTMYNVSEKVYKEPKSYKQAMQSEDSLEWRKATEEEIAAINKNQTWELTKLPNGRKPIGCKWVFKRKKNNKTGVITWKARLVALGNFQKYGVDYDETFAPVARTATFRMLLSIAGERNYKVNHFDIKTAFLNGKLDEDIYMKQPQGFQQGDDVYKLKKSLYGLKQAARVWNKTLHAILEKYNFKKNDFDQCLYSKTSNEKVCHLLVHVDDILAVYNDDEFLETSINNIGKHFELKNLGEVSSYLSINVERSGMKFSISQENYIEKIIETAKLVDAKDSKFPIDTGYFKLEGKLLDSNEEYRKLIGMLLYVAINTRPDIAASTSILSKRIEEPRDVDLNEVKRVIRYLKGTKSLKLQLNARNGENLHAYSDANWAEDKSDRKSNSGYYCAMNGGAMSWCCKKQDITALSSTEAEYVALTETCREVVWLRNLAKSLEIQVIGTTTVFTDNQSCISMISNEKFSNRTKHIDTKFHYVRDQVTNGTVKLIYCPTEENVADLLTKPLGSIKIVKHRVASGLIGLQTASQCEQTQCDLRRSVERCNNITLTNSNCACDGNTLLMNCILQPEFIRTIRSLLFESPQR